MPLRPALVLLALVLTATLAQAQWVWRKDGRVTASDMPPPADVPDKDILQRPAGRRAAPPPAAASLPASATAAKPGVDPELEARRRAAEAEQQAKARAAEDEKLAPQRAANCRNAREQLAVLESGRRISRVNARGEREAMDDAARAQAMKQAQDVIASDCR